MRLIIALFLISFSAVAADLPTCTADQVLVFRRSNTQSELKSKCESGHSTPKPGRVVFCTGTNCGTQNLSDVLKMIERLKQQAVQAESGTTPMPSAAEIAAELAARLGNMNQVQTVSAMDYWVPAIAVAVGAAITLVVVKVGGFSGAPAPMQRATSIGIPRGRSLSLVD